MLEKLIKNPWFYRTVFLLVGGFGVAATLAGYVNTRDQERTQQKLVFERLAASYFEAIDTKFDNLTNVLKASRALIYASSAVSRDEFKAFVEGLEPSRSVRALEWIPRVAHSQRKPREAAMRAWAGGAVTFTERTPDGRKVPAARRAEYFPVYFVEPLAGNEAAIGFDLASNPTRLKALDRARDTGKPVATGRISLVQDASGEYGFLVFVPVYANGRTPATRSQRRTELTGFVLVVFQFSDLVQSSAARLKGINLHIVDDTAAPGKSLLYPRGGKDSLAAARAAEFRYVRSLAYGERRWSIIISLDAAINQSVTAYALLIGGLLFTGFILMFFRLIHRQAEIVERDVLVRTAELEEANASIEKAAIIMEDAYRRAETANQSKSDFVAKISHEIRTPLNGMLGVADLLLTSGLGPEQKKHAQIIRDSGKNMNVILNDLLDLSKIEAGRLDLEIINFRLPDLIDSVKALWHGPFRSKSLYLRTDIAPDIPPVLLTDPNRVRQILMNLFSNALKFTETGGVALVVTGVEAADGDWALRFEVIDTGPGIDPEAQAQIFADYQQAHKSTARKFGGTGLGLAICKQLAQRLGGEIGVTGTPGAGSTFWFTIQCGKGDPDKVKSADRAADTTVIENYQAERAMQILVADDNKINRLLLKEMLCRWGHRVDFAENGLEALDAVKTSRFDLVLMDVHMPEMDGVAATEKIRALPGDTAQTLIVGISADAMKGAREKYLAVGMDDYVTKPVDFPILAQTIDRLCGCKTDPELVESSVQLLTGQAPRPKPMAAETARSIEDLIDRLATTPPVADPVSRT